MRRAGYEVSVLPAEAIGWEENPPTLIEYIRRDVRLVPGQHAILVLSHLAGPEAVSRYQLAFAIWMFFAPRPGSDCWCSAPSGW